MIREVGPTSFRMLAEHGKLYAGLMGGYAGLVVCRT